MRFQRIFERAQFPEWREHYVHYAELKALLRPQAGHADAQECSRAFREAWQREVDRVNAFVDVQAEGMCAEDSVESSAGTALADAALMAPIATLSDEDTASTARRRGSTEASALWRMWFALRRFAEFNYTALYKALAAHDKHTGLQLLPVLVRVLDLEPFTRVLHEPTPAATAEGLPPQHPWLAYVAARRRRLSRSAAQEQGPGSELATRKDEPEGAGRDAVTVEVVGAPSIGPQTPSAVAAFTGVIDQMEEQLEQETHAAPTRRARSTSAHAIGVSSSSGSRQGGLAAVRIFEDYLAAARHSVSSFERALKALTPELRSAPKERKARMKPVRDIAGACMREIEHRMHHHYSARETATLAHQALLMIFGESLDVLTSEISLLYPEGAAALGQLSSTFRAQFVGGTARTTERGPGAGSIALLHRLQQSFQGRAARRRAPAPLPSLPLTVQRMRRISLPGLRLRAPSGSVEVAQTWSQHAVATFAMDSRRLHVKLPVDGRGSASAEVVATTAMPGSRRSLSPNASQELAFASNPRTIRRTKSVTQDSFRRLSAGLYPTARSPRRRAPSSEGETQRELTSLRSAGAMSSSLSAAPVVPAVRSCGLLCAAPSVGWLSCTRASQAPTRPSRNDPHGASPHASRGESSSLVEAAVAPPVGPRRASYSTILPAVRTPPRLGEREATRAGLSGRVSTSADTRWTHRIGDKSPWHASDKSAPLRSPGRGSKARALRYTPLPQVAMPAWMLALYTALGLREFDPYPTWQATIKPQRPFLSLLWDKFKPNVIDWLPEYDWRKKFPSDAMAGMTIGIMVVPQGLALARLAGLPPHYGLYCGLPAALYAALGTSKHAAIGPMSMVALLIAAGVQSIAPPQEHYVGTVMSITFLSGCLLLLMGWLNLGFVVRFISRPVLSGFSSASAIITTLSAVQDMLGVRIPRSQLLHDYVSNIVVALPATHGPTLITGIAALFLLLMLPYWKPAQRVPAPLFVVVFFIILFAIIMAASHDDGIAASGNFTTASGIKLVGEVPKAFPPLQVPYLPSGSSLLPLLTTAISITFVGFIESIAVAKTYALENAYEISASSELKALGVVNVFGSFMQSFVIMGAFSRSAVNVRAGAKTQLTQVISTLVVILTILVATPALYYLPSCVLGALIIAASTNLVDIKGAVRLWRVDKKDLAALLAAFIATLFLGVLPGVVVAMGFSLLVFLAITTQPRVEELGRLAGTVIYRHIGMVGVTRVADVKIIRFLAPLFFANCSVLRDRLLHELTTRSKQPPRLQWRALILCFSSVSSIDSTSMQVLEEIITEYHRQKAIVFIASANAIVERTLNDAGVVARLGGPSFLFRRVHEAVRAILLRDITIADLPRVTIAPAVVGGVSAAPTHALTNMPGTEPGINPPVNRASGKRWCSAGCGRAGICAVDACCADAGSVAAHLGDVRSVSNKQLSRPGALPTHVPQPIAFDSSAGGNMHEMQVVSDTERDKEVIHARTSNAEGSDVMHTAIDVGSATLPTVVDAPRIRHGHEQIPFGPHPHATSLRRHSLFDALAVESPPSTTRM